MKNLCSVSISKLKITKTMSQEEDWQIIERFNFNVRKKFFNKFLSLYLLAIHSEFDRRGIDYSRIGNSKKLSFDREVVLISNVLIPISSKLTDFSKEQVQIMLEKFLEEKHPDKLKFYPKVISFNDKSVFFGMCKHNGRLRLSSTFLFDPEMQMISATEKELKCIYFLKSFKANNYFSESRIVFNSIISRLKKFFFNKEKIISSLTDESNNDKPLVSISKTLKELWGNHGPSYFMNSKYAIDCLGFWAKELHGIKKEIILDLEKSIMKQRKERLDLNRKMFEEHQLEIFISFRKIELEIIDEIDKIFGDYNPYK